MVLDYSLIKIITELYLVVDQAIIRPKHLPVFIQSDDVVYITDDMTMNDLEERQKVQKRNLQDTYADLFMR